MHSVSAWATTNGWIARLIAIVLGAVVLMFPALINKSPYLFHDTDAYYRTGQSVVTEILGGSETAAGPQDPSDVAQAAGHKISHLSARSPFYSLLLYVLAGVAGLWGIVVVQAVAASCVVWRAARQFAPDHEFSSFVAILTVAAMGTSLPWYVSFAMPDVWLGLWAFMFIIVTFSPRRITVADTIALVLLTFAAAAFHTSNAPVVLGGMLAAAMIAAAFKLFKENALQSCAAAGLGLLIAFVAGWGFHRAAERHFHERLRMPIFLTARLLADGPGKAYLLQSCAEDETRYTLCKFKDHPFNNSDAILWSKDPNRGVYAVADLKTRLALSDEQSSFALSTLRFDPLGVAAAATKNTGIQLSKFGLAEFSENYWQKWADGPPGRRLAIFEVMPDTDFCLANFESCEPTRAVFFFDVIEKTVFLFSFAFLLWNVLQSTSSARPVGLLEKNVAALSLLLFAIIVCNAFVCGALAGPNERYQARLIWIAPILATLFVLSRREALVASFRREFSPPHEKP